MKPKKYKSLGFEIEVMVPESIEEYNQLAGRDNAALDDAVDNIVYHSSKALPKFRKTLCELVEKKYGVQRETAFIRDPRPGEDPEDVPTRYVEPESKFITRVLNELDLSHQDLTDLVKEAATDLVANPSVNEPTSVQTKVAKKWLVIAEALAAKGKLEAYAAKFNIPATLEDVARHIQTEEKRKEAERFKELENNL